MLTYARSLPWWLAALTARSLERPFSHLYETGGMRRVHLRCHTNIRKRLLIHAGGFNLGLLMRRLIGVGTPRPLRGRLVSFMATLLALTRALREVGTRHRRPAASIPPLEHRALAKHMIATTVEA